MAEYVDVRIPVPKLEAHVRSICRSNLKKPAKVCVECPILGPVLDVMDKYGWQYAYSLSRTPDRHMYERCADAPEPP